MTAFLENLTKNKSILEFACQQQPSKQDEIMYSAETAILAPHHQHPRPSGEQTFKRKVAARIDAGKRKAIKTKTAAATRAAMTIGKNSKNKILPTKTPVTSKRRTYVKKKNNRANAKRKKNKKKLKAGGTSSTNNPRRVIPAIKDYIPEHEPTAVDVVSGRGGRTNRHPGNRPYWIRVLETRDMYKQCSLNDDDSKRSIAQSIVDYITTDRGGRFVQLELSTGRWFVLPNKVVLDKVRQALRDKYVPSWWAERAKEEFGGLEQEQEETGGSSSASFSKSPRASKKRSAPQSNIINSGNTTPKKKKAKTVTFLSTIVAPPADALGGNRTNIVPPGARTPSPTSTIYYDGSSSLHEKEDEDTLLDQEDILALSSFLQEVDDPQLNGFSSVGGGDSLSPSLDVNDPNDGHSSTGGGFVDSAGHNNKNTAVANTINLSLPSPMTSNNNTVAPLDDTIRSLDITDNNPQEGEYSNTADCSSSAADATLPSCSWESMFVEAMLGVNYY